jgi:RNA polymerase sigma-70 factor (ECF subfamily)
LHALEVEELAQQIDQAIDQLPERCRLVFLLSRYEDLTYREIAEKLDIKEKTVENQIVKALKLLRKYLAPYLSSILLIFIKIYFT